jgi:glutathione S-transferase
MKLFYSPNACSLGIHVVLEEIGKPFETILSSARDGSLYKPEYTAMNPKSKVPALVRDDGSVLTEYPAISMYLGRSNPEAHLIPADLEGEVRMLEAIDYITATIHMQGFTRISRPERFGTDIEAVKEAGREIYRKGMAIMDAQLAGRDWIVGPYSLADAALLYVENWSLRDGALALPANCAAHYARMKQRPAVQRAFTKEGLPL